MADWVCVVGALGWGAIGAGLWGAWAWARPRGLEGARGRSTAERAELAERAGYTLLGAPFRGAMSDGAMCGDLWVGSSWLGARRGRGKKGGCTAEGAEHAEMNRRSPAVCLDTRLSLRSLRIAVRAFCAGVPPRRASAIDGLVAAGPVDPAGGATVPRCMGALLAPSAGALGQWAGRGSMGLLRRFLVRADCGSVSPR
jgi:hypothetical protein